jgi:hypothetical protein
MCTFTYMCLICMYVYIHVYIYIYIYIYLFHPSHTLFASTFNLFHKERMRNFNTLHNYSRMSSIYFIKNICVSVIYYINIGTYDPCTTSKNRICICSMMHYLKALCMYMFKVFPQGIVYVYVK